MAVPVNIVMNYRIWGNKPCSHVKGDCNLHSTERKPSDGFC